MKSVLRLFFSLVVPVFLMVGAFVTAYDRSLLPVPVVPVLPWLPYVFCFTGAALAWRFKRSRVVFLLALLAAAYWLTTGLFSSGPASAWDIGLGYAAMCLLLPINIALLECMEDRGVLSGWGLLHLAFLLVQAGAVSVLMGARVFFSPQTAEEVLLPAWRIVFYQPLPDWAGAWISSWTGIPEVALLVTGIILFALVGHWALFTPSRDAMHGALLTTIICAMAGLHHARQPETAAVFFCAGALIVMLTLFQESYSMAFADELTTLPARRALMADSKRLGRRYAVAMCDIDHFKKFNDTFGHDVGDDVLRMVAGHLARVTGGGTAYRYGGEEFTILFPKLSAQEAAPHLNAVREAIAGTAFRIRGPLPKKARGKDTVTVTLSIGVAERGDEASSVEQVIKCADTALYKAKKGGRNKVVVA